MKLKPPAGGGKSLISFNMKSIIYSIDSFERLIHSGMKQVTVFMNGESWITRFVQKRSSFMNETPLCLLLEMRSGSAVTLFRTIFVDESKIMQYLFIDLLY